mgnify:CR=1 FL=1
MKKLIFSILLTLGGLPGMAQMTLNDCLVYARDHVNGAASANGKH